MVAENDKMEKPSSNIVWALIGTILGCWPIGLVAIIKAAKVDQLWHKGYEEEAWEKSFEVKKWSIAAVVTSLVVFVLTIILYFGLLIAVAPKV